MNTIKLITNYMNKMHPNRELKSKLKYVLRELYYLNKLASIGAFSLLRDAIQIKTGMIFLSRTSGTEISNKVSGLSLGQTIIGITTYAIMQGITVGMCTLCSQTYGAGNHKLVGTYFMRALLIGITHLLSSVECLDRCNTTGILHHWRHRTSRRSRSVHEDILFRISCLHILQVSKRVLTVSEYRILNHVYHGR